MHVVQFEVYSSLNGAGSTAQVAVIQNVLFAASRHVISLEPSLSAELLVLRDQKDYVF